MDYIFTFLFCFIVWYVIYYLLIVHSKKGLEKFKNGRQFIFFEKAYKIDFDKVSLKSFAKSLGLVNGFIIAFVVTIVQLFKSFLVKLLVGFIILFPLMIFMYYLLGKFYEKKARKS